MGFPDVSATPADRVAWLKAEYGSDDKLADALGTSRQRVIDWRHGATPSKVYREKLAALPESQRAGFVTADFRYPTDAAAVRKMADALERQIGDATQLLAALRAAGKA